MQDEQLSFLGFLDQPNQRRTRVDDCEEGISAFQFESAGPLPAVSDKWVLASNLQKAIRRGLKDVAISTAIKLVGMDAAYFWRRLLVIGYEDVGFGDLPLCASLLGTFRRTALHRRLGVEKVAGYFADRLCSAVKSRALCDAIAMLEFSVKLHKYENIASRFPPGSWSIPRVTLPVPRWIGLPRFATCAAIGAGRMAAIKPQPEPSRIY